MLIGCNETFIKIEEISSAIESITIYDLDGFRELEYSQNELEKATKASLDIILFRELAPLTHYSSSSPLWKGSSLAIVKLNNGKEIKIAISYYGGFFSILGQKGYYYFEDSAKDKWNNIFMGIVQKNFVPNRI